MPADPRDILLFVIAAMNLVLGFLVLARNKRSWVNIAYSLVVLGVAFWSIGLVYFRNATDFSSALFWAHNYYVAAAAIAYVFLIFGLVFPYAKIKFTPLKHIIILIPFLVVSYLVFTPYHIEAIFIQQWGKDVILGWAYVVYTVYFIMYMAGGFWSIWKKDEESVGIRKMQIRYVLLGTLIAAAGGSVFNLFYPLFGNYQYIWLGPLFSFLMVVFIAYAIIRYRLMNIRLILSRIMHYAFSFTASFIIADFVLYLLGVFDSLSNSKAITVCAVLAMLVIILHDYLQRIFVKITANIFFRGQPNYQSVLKDIGEIISRQVSRDGLVYAVSKNLYDKLKVKHVRIYVKDQNNDTYRILGSDQEPILSSSVIISQMKKTRTALVTEELELKQNDTADKEEYIKLDKLVNELHKFNIALVAPVVLESELIAIITLGQKQSKDIFDKELIGLFDVLSPQIATALAKAHLYDEAKLFNIRLKSEIDKATKELRVANKHLLELDHSKSEFLSIAAHQLRTPLTGIKGYLSMFLEGDFGDITQEQKVEMEKMYRSSDRLTRLIDVFLNVSRIETGRLDLKKENFNIEQVVDEVMSDLSHQAKIKGLQLTIQKPDEPIGQILADKDKIHDVVMNLLDNSIKYTEKGWINIRLSRSKSLMVFEVKDSGIGIDSGEIDKLFQKFSRAEAISRIHTGGSGLGLFIARKIVEAHRGRIWAESEGKGKGSSFTFTLPINAVE